MIPEKIGFIGLGHIGGSVAKTVHRIYPDIQIVAYDTCRATLDAVSDIWLVLGGRSFVMRV